MFNYDYETVSTFFLHVVCGLVALFLTGCWVNFSRPSTGVTISFTNFAMHPPGNKKATGHKKAYTHLPEDDNYTRKTRKGHPSTPITLKNDAQLTPKHMPVPQLIGEGEKLFEFLNSVFGLIALGLQYLNLYKTSWWEIDSNTFEAMNKSLINQQLTLFLATILTIRLGHIIFMAPLKWLLPSFNTYEPYISYAFRMTLITVMFGQLFVVAFVNSNSPILNLFYILYPTIVYVILFGLESRPLFVLENEKPAMHSCTNDPAVIRDEIITLREHFNYRMKIVLFWAFATAYYSSFVPCCYAQSFLNYNSFYVVGQAVLVFCTMFCRLACQLLSIHYCDVLHRSTIHLGYWKPIPEGVEFDYPLWIPTKLYGRGAKVSYLGKGYICITKCAAGDPSVARFRRFYDIFRNPSRMIGVLLYVQLGVIIFQIMILLTNLYWHYTLANMIIIFMNYFTLFKYIRDYLISWKIYRAEYLIQQKPYENFVKDLIPPAPK